MLCRTITRRRVHVRPPSREEVNDIVYGAPSPRELDVATQTRPKWRLWGFMSMASHCLSNTDEPSNGVRATMSSVPLCITFQEAGVTAPRGRTAIPKPDLGSEGLTSGERKKCSPSLR